MEHEKLDIHKIMAMLMQPKEKPEPLKDVEIRRVEIPYITKDESVDRRPIRIYLPLKASRPTPLIFIAHYEMTEDALELRAYLNKGWAVASPTETGSHQNAQLTDDDLVFNNAALYELRHMIDFDADRIAVVGGSAGGYMALMLDALQMGICCSIANSAITNVYFTVSKYFAESRKYNIQAFLEMTPEERKNIVGNLAKLPIPFLGAVSGLFSPIQQRFPEPDDMERWEAFSPVGLTEWFCNPILMTHITSDILVPIDQLSKRFTYSTPGESLPADYFHRLPSDIEGKLKFSLEERLPEAETQVLCIPMPEGKETFVLPFDEGKRFNIDIFDEGPIESYGSHGTRPSTAVIDQTHYLETMFAKTAKITNILSVEKLQMLVQRYQGKSVQLPAHRGIDDSVYGSLEIYRKEVIDALEKWSKDHGKDQLDVLFAAVLSQEKDPVANQELRMTLKAIGEAL